MKQKIIVVALGCTIMFALPAQAQNMVGIYVKAKLGLSVQKQSGHNSAGTNRIGIDSKNKSVAAAGISIGYDLANKLQYPVRVEYEYTWRGNGNQSSSKLIAGSAVHKKSEVRTQSHMVNALYNFDFGSAFRPYVQAGIGLACHDLEARAVDSNGSWGTASGNKTKFAWGVGAGVVYQITPDWSVDIGYRFLDAGKVSASTTGSSGYSMKARYHDFLLGVRYNF